MENCPNNRTAKIGGWVLTQVWALAWDNMVAFFSINYWNLSRNCPVIRHYYELCLILICSIPWFDLSNLKVSLPHVTSRVAQNTRCKCGRSGDDTSLNVTMEMRTGVSEKGGQGCPLLEAFLYLYHYLSSCRIMSIILVGCCIILGWSRASAWLKPFTCRWPHMLTCIQLDQLLWLSLVPRLHPRGEGLVTSSWFLGLH